MQADLLLSPPGDITGPDIYTIFPEHTLNFTAPDPECLFCGREILLILQTQFKCQLPACPALTCSAEIVAGLLWHLYEDLLKHLFCKSSLLALCVFVCFQHVTINSMEQRLFVHTF